MKILSWAFLAILSFSTATSWAEPASLRTSAIKLSKSLRGIPLSTKEFQDLEQAIQSGRGEEYYQTMIKSFVKSENFERKLKFKVDELFRMKTELGGAFQFGDLENRNQEQLFDSTYDFLVKDLIGNNESWDQLLLAKDYRFLLMENLFGSPLKEREFFAALTGFTNVSVDLDVPEINYSDRRAKEYKFHFEKDEGRIAGVITTPRFLSKYVNTGLNKNRKRAAAIFRVFLCDSMMAAVPPRDSSTEKVDFDMIFPHNGTETEEQIRSGTKGADLHGVQRDCMACHYKLDPMGQTLGFSSAGLSPDLSPGALKYKSVVSGPIDIPLAGVGHLAQALVGQEDYVRCQVDHFWNWYIGRDAPKTEKRQTELVKKFNELGRKPKDFIAFLASMPEFRTKPQVLNENQLMARNAGAILKNCFDCHRNQDQNQEVQSWDLTDLPYGRNPESRQARIDSLIDVLDLKGDGSHRTMPTKSSVWKLSDDQYSVLKKWIRQGAPDYEGKPQVAPW